MRTALLFIPSALVVLAMVLHSLKVRGKRETLLFFLFGFLFGVLRGNIIWWITTVHFGGRFPYVFTNKVFGVFHDSFQADIGWILTVYLGWCFAERLLARTQERARSLFHTVSLAALFATALSYAVESSAIALGWWNWNLGVKSRFLIDVPIAGIAAWFSVPIDFFLPFLALARFARRGVWHWATLAIFPLHMLVHLSNDRLSESVPITPFNLFYWVAALFALLAPLRRPTELPPSVGLRSGWIARLPGWVATAVPAFAVTVVLGVLLIADLLIARDPHLLYSLAPVSFLTAMVYIPAPGWVWLGLAAGAAVVGGKLLWPLLLVAALIVLWRGEWKLPRSARRLLLIGLPIVLTIPFWLDARARDQIDRQYGDTCSRALAAAKRGDLAGSVRLYDSAIALRPHNVRAYEEQAQVLVHQQDYRRAEATYRRLLELRPISPELMTNLGNVLYLQGRQDEAIEAYRTALRFDPAYATARETLRKLGRSTD